MADKEPRIRLELVASATQNPLENLQEGAVDVVLASSHLAVPGIDAIPVFKVELILVTHLEHCLANKACIEVFDLEGEDYLTYRKTAMPGFEYERFIRPSGVVPHVVTVVEVTYAIIELISSGFGVSILSKWAVQTALQSNKLSAVSLGKDSLELGWSALVRESEANSTDARTVSRRLAQWFKA
jgi:LysR family transcriptional regulator for metE and metH